MIMIMQFYMAPMEGLTGYVYRNAYQKHYGGVTRYFTPFLTNKKMNHRELNDILPEHNQGMEVVPQILANRADDFCCIAGQLREYGYHMVNLNLGCPSGTVVARNRGAGFLAFPEELDAFLDEIFTRCQSKISVKTRIGRDAWEEWERLLAIYEKYPLEELIIHPRVQKDFYNNTVNLEAYGLAERTSRHALCCNGDICTVEDFKDRAARFPETKRMMLGRGLLKNPGLIEEIRRSMDVSGGADVLETQEQPPQGVPKLPETSRLHDTEQKKARLRAFHDDILCGYQAVMYGDRPTLFKMKELWVYLGESFSAPEKYLKKIKKTERIREYELIVDALFRERELR